jgi:predicted metal-dependent phosphoesterase TrpH
VNATGTLRVDWHVHTVASGDAVTTLDQLAERVGALDLDVICITDHHVISTAVDAVARDLGVRVIIGEEIRTSVGEIVGLFLSSRIPYVLPVRDAVDRIHAQGGIVYLPHPYDPLRCSVGADAEALCRLGLVDAVEVFNAKIREPLHNAAAAALAARWDLPGGAGSDAHDPAGLGAAYLEMPDFDGPQDFLSKLPGARVVGEFREHAPRFGGEAERRRPSGSLNRSTIH